MAKTKAEIKNAIKTTLGKVLVGEGGSINGCLTITGGGNFLKTPQLFIGETDVTDLMERSGKVKTVNGVQPDESGDVSIPTTITINSVESDENGAITLTPQDVNALPITGGTLTGELNVYTPTGNQIHLGRDNKGVIFRNDGVAFYLLTTADDDPWGTWNDLRPFNVNLTTGSVTIGHGIYLASGQIIKEATASSWVTGRDNALLRVNNGASYCPVFSVKCANGTWDVGSSGSNNGSNLAVSYVTDANYNAGTNATTFQHKFTSDGDFVAHRDLRATSWVYATNFRVSSDIRLKKDIKSVDYSLPDVQLKSFKFKKEERDKIHIGYIAQEVQKQTPQFVDKDSEGYLSLDESALLMTAIAEINKLKKKVIELEKAR